MRDTCTPIADEVICGKEISKRVKCFDGSLRKPVPDPNLEIKVDRGGLQKKFYRPFRPQFCLKIRGASGIPGPPGPSPGSATENSRHFTTPQAITNFTWGRGCRKI